MFTRYGAHFFYLLRRITGAECRRITLMNSNNHPHRAEMFANGTRNVTEVENNTGQRISPRQVRKLKRFAESRIMADNDRLEVVIRPQFNIN